MYLNEKEMIIGRGFTFPYKKREVFVDTDYKNVTKTLCLKICKALELPDNPEVIRELKYFIRKCVCTKRYSGKRNTTFYNLIGDGFASVNYEKEDIIFITI